MSKELLLNETADFWDLRAEEFEKSRSLNRVRTETEEALAYLENKNALKENFKVLEIGCGAGRLTIPVAKRVQSVVAVDISPKMIEATKRYAREEGVDNIEFLQMSWEKMKENRKAYYQKFDLVIAYECGAIKNRDSFYQLSEFAKKHVFVSLYAKRKDEYQLMVARKLFKVKKDKKRNFVFKIFEFLWNNGYYPEITYHDKAYSKILPLEIIARIYGEDFVKEKDSREKLIEATEKVYEFLEPFAIGGMITENVKAKAAWFFWSKNAGRKSSNDEKTPTYKENAQST